LLTLDSMHGVKLSGWVIGALIQVQGAALAAVPAWTSTLAASVGRPLDADYGKTSFLFEPSVTATWKGAAVLSFRSVFERSLAPFQKIQVPVAESLLSIPLLKGPTLQWSAFVQASLLEVESWGAEGPQSRLAAGASLEWRPHPSLTLDGSTGPYVGLHALDQRYSGERFSKGGWLAQLRLMLEWQRFRLELLALVLEDWNELWHTRYATFERLSFRVLPAFRVGIAHQLFRNRIEDASGMLGPIGFFDGRRSRFSGFVQWQL
jgi:hypothetical protein